MNWEQIQGKWMEYKGKVKQRWGKLTDSDLTVINGKRDILAGKIMERSGMAKAQVEKEIAEFEASCSDSSKSESSSRSSASGSGVGSRSGSQSGVPSGAAKVTARKPADGGM